MKAVSLWQPWASLMALGLKKDETRDYPTSHRGPLLIHAALRKVQIPVEVTIAISKLVPSDYQFYYGALLCKVDLIGCEKVDLFNKPEGPAESIFGDYTPGRYIWKTANLVTFPHPIPYKGKQGFFDVPFEVIKEVLK